MGEMASGLAHELNQPLAAIVAYVDACQELVESGRINNQQLIDVCERCRVRRNGLVRSSIVCGR